MDKDIEKVLDENRDILMDLPNVNGVGIVEKNLPNGKSEKCLQVTVDEKVSSANLKRSERIPKKLDGFRIVVREIGTISPEG